MQDSATPKASGNQAGKQPLPAHLDKKYAQLWNETCGGVIPKSLVPFTSDGNLTDREQHIYSEALWKVLDMMANDGLITQAALRVAHEKENGWKPGHSKIKSGYVPPRKRAKVKQAKAQ